MFAVFNGGGRSWNASSLVSVRYGGWIAVGLKQQCKRAGLYNLDRERENGAFGVFWRRGNTVPPLLHYQAEGARSEQLSIFTSHVMISLFLSCFWISRRSGA